MAIRALRAIAFLALITTFIQCNNPSQTEVISFYRVPLTCGAAPDLGCGSRIKPMFVDTEKEKDIKESWTNREGTVIAIVWTGNENEKLIQSLFTKNDIEAKLLYDSAEVKNISAGFREKGKWLKGMEVDQLSTEEAGVIAKDLTQFAEDAKLITAAERENIRKDIEAYFKKELVAVRTYENLKSSATQNKWILDGYSIYEKYIGRQRADSVKAYYAEHKEECTGESCCDEEKNEKATTSEITCPKCGFKKTETLPSDVCVVRYTCEKCKTNLFPKEGDCCVFCTYGTHKCPSKQSE
jgi:hypothetical protein